MNLIHEQMKAGVRGQGYFKFRDGVNGKRGTFAEQFNIRHLKIT